jgi:hypothetical protein
VTDTPALLLGAKVALVAVVVLLATHAARRFGHGVGGLLAGLPLIAAPITGLLLLQLPAEQVRGVCLATLVCQPALIAYLVTYAQAAGRLQRPRWPLCLALSLGVFAALGSALLQLQLPPAASVAGAVAAPFLGWHLLPARRLAAGPGGPLPRSELASRLAVAMAVATGVLWGAEHLSAGVAGLLLATPITGIVLPSFTLPRHGAAATQALLAGFIRGQTGFVAFFVVMVLTLPLLTAGLAWATALAAAALLPWAVARLRR